MADGMKTAVIVGGGAVGIDFHLPCLREVVGVRDVLVVEPSAARRAEVAARLAGAGGIEVVAELPAGRRFDLAVVATPPRFHPEYVERLGTRCGLLLIEKPLARNAEEGRAIVDHLATPGAAPALVCHIRRTLGSFRQVRALLASGLLGALRAVEVDEGGVFGWRAASLGSFSRDLNGGGVLLDTGPHTLDLLLQVFDRLTLDAAWMDAPMAAPGRAIEANCLLELRAGAVPVSVALSRNRHFSNTAVFRFERGEVLADVRDNGLRVVAGGVDLAGFASGRRLGFAELFTGFYRDYVLAAGDAAPRPQDALAGLELIDAAYRAARPMPGGY